MKWIVLVIVLLTVLNGCEEWERAERERKILTTCETLCKRSKEAHVCFESCIKRVEKMNEDF